MRTSDHPLGRELGLEVAPVVAVSAVARTFTTRDDPTVIVYS